MSANLLDGATVTRGTKDADGYWVLSQNDGTDKKDSPMWRIDGQPTLTENQTVHMACSVMPDEDLSTNAINMGVEYKDAAGNANWTGAYSGKNAKAGVWTRLEMECVVPSGMHVDWAVLTNAYSYSSGAKVTGIVISYGSPIVLASSAHTPYATQDHVAAEYATKAALKVTSDAVTAEVTERGKLAGRVGTLESTSGTHASKLEQLASSIRSLVKGESTYTDPDGKSATSGIYSLVTQTRDSVTALFGQYTKTADMQSQIATAKSQATAAANSATDSKLSSYTKTADLASTQAVKDAKKAGTDAASAASAAQSTADTAKSNAATAQSTADEAKSTAQTAASDAATAKTNASTAVSTANDASTDAANAVKTANAASSTASSASSTANSAASTANAAKDTADSAVSTANSANSTANTAKSTADSLATMIREDATGITVGKSADGQTYSTGRTHMDEDSFDILDKAGTVITQLAGDGASFLSGLVRIVAGKVSLPGADSVDSITIDAGGGVATVSGLISRLSGLYNGISSTVTAGFATYGGNGITATVRDTESDIVANATLGVDKATVGIGGQYVKMKGDAFELSNPEYLLSALMDTRKVPGSLDTCGPGVFSYNGSTANRPTDYGVCLSFVAGSGDWLFQLALPTMGDPLWRRNINGAGWEGWWTITSQ